MTLVRSTLELHCLRLDKLRRSDHFGGEKKEEKEEKLEEKNKEANNNHNVNEICAELLKCKGSAEGQGLAPKLHSFNARVFLSLFLPSRAAKVERPNELYKT